ncbi:hypothetical protein [Ascidiimonas aurantiaca]|uniref:hypothetical protein n=1 Tax=Ascidiimonas aurantiaca TaxID=1685432 RepID=UPI0030EEA6E4
MKVLIIYLKQRMRILPLSGWSLFLILYAGGYPLVADKILLPLLPVFFFLFLMQWYEDLMTNTSAAENYIFKHKECRKLLTIIWVAIVIVFITIFLFISPIIAVVLAVFFMVNDLLYRVLAGWSLRHLFLPAFKYPLVTALLLALFGETQKYLLFVGITLASFTAFMAFTCMQSYGIRHRMKKTGFWSILTGVLLFSFGTIWQYGWLYLAGTFVLVAVSQSKHSRARYWFLLVFLVLKTAYSYLL